MVYQDNLLKRSLLLVLTSVMALLFVGLFGSKVVLATDADIFEFEEVNGELHLTKLKRDLLSINTDVTIPSEVDGKPVVKIGIRVFEGSTIGELFIPGTITEIERGAFVGTKIRKVIFNEGLEVIGSGAFEDADIKRDLVFPSSLKTIEHDAFLDSSIGTIVFNEGVSSLTIENDAFRGTSSDRPISGTLKLPNNLTVLGNEVFEDNNISNIIFGSGLNTVPESSFRNNNLTEVFLPKNIKTVEDEAFANNSDLTTLRVQGKDTKFDDNPFNASGLDTIIGYPGSTAETLANDLGITFINGGGNVSTTTHYRESQREPAVIELNAEGLTNLEYTWKQSQSDESNWKSFASGDIIETPNDMGGEIFLYVRGTNLLRDNFSSTFSTVANLVDPDAPNITSDSANDWNNQNVTITIEDGIDPYSDIDKTEYRINGGDWKKYEQELVISDEGETLIEARTINEHGFESELSKHTVKIDKTNPTINVEIDIDNNRFVITASDELSGIDRINLPSGMIVNSDEAHYRIDGPGTYNFVAFDKAGNQAYVGKTVTAEISRKQLEVDSNTPYYFVSGETVEIVDDSGNVLATLKMPNFDLDSDLHRASILVRSVNEDDLTLNNLQVAGQVLDILFVEDGYDPSNPEEDLVIDVKDMGDFTLSLLVDENSTNEVAIYHEVNEGIWKRIGGDLEDGIITATVTDFSKYGVFAKVEDPSDPKDPEDPSKPKEPEIDPCESQDPLAAGCPEDQIKDLEDDGTPKSTDDTIKPTKDGKVLPKTATSTFNLMMVGVVLLLVGGATYIYFNRRQRNVSEK